MIDIYIGWQTTGPIRLAPNSVVKTVDITALLRDLLEDVQEHHAANEWKKHPETSRRNNEEWAAREALIQRAKEAISLMRPEKRT